jgi:periplasmic copper chaperone A
MTVGSCVRSHSMMTLKSVVLGLALFSLPAFAQTSHDLMIVNAFAPAPLVPTAQAAAVYFTVMNHGPEDDELLSVSTPAATSATLHTSVLENDVWKMRPLTSIDIPPGALVQLVPGARHVMLTGLKAPLKEGDNIALRLLFEKAGTIDVTIPVGKAVQGHEHHTP